MINLFVILPLYSNVIMVKNQLKFSVNKKACVELVVVLSQVFMSNDINRAPTHFRNQKLRRFEEAF